MMAAALADGVTVIENAARERRKLTAILLNEIRPRSRERAETITVTGVEELHGTTRNVGTGPYRSRNLYGSGSYDGVAMSSFECSLGT